MSPALNPKMILSTLLATVGTVASGPVAHAATQRLGTDGQGLVETGIQSGILGVLLVWVLRELVAKRLDSVTTELQKMQILLDASHDLLMEVVTKDVDLTDESDTRIRNLSAILKRVEANRQRTHHLLKGQKGQDP